MKPLKLALSLFLLFFLTVSNAQDWANLKRFQKENSKLMNTITNDRRIVLMGNSITEGWSNVRPEFFANKPFIINRGIGGQTTPQMLLRFKQDVINLKPSVVVILAGINDIAGNTGPSTIEMIMNNIISMAELAKDNNIKVVLCSILPANNIPWRPDIEPTEKVLKINGLIKDYTIKHHLVFIDYFSSMVDEHNGLKEALGYDSVHPNAAGYSIMEPLLEEGIAKALF